jgi:hypothetical protein
VEGGGLAVGWMEDATASTTTAAASFDNADDDSDLLKTTPVRSIQMKNYAQHTGKKRSKKPTMGSVHNIKGGKVYKSQR